LLRVVGDAHLAAGLSAGRHSRFEDRVDAGDPNVIEGDGLSFITATDDPDPVRAGGMHRDGSVGEQIEDVIGPPAARERVGVEARIAAAGERRDSLIVEHQIDRIDRVRATGHAKRTA
jgi:hypothetical protein